MTGPKDIGAADRVNTPDGKTPLGKVRGLGSSHHGGEHWIRERVSAAALLLLGVWLIASLLMLPDFSQATFAEWLRGAGGAVPMALLVYLAFEHSLEGVKVVIDDYQGEEGGRLTWTVASLFLHVGVGAVALFSLAKIAFGGGQ